MVLLIDDDEAMRAFLLMEGYAVESVSDGEEALRWFKDSKMWPELILLAIRMPALEGWRFLWERRTDTRLASIPVVIMSTASISDRAAEAAGVATVLIKPFNREAVLQAIEEFALRLN
jgi:CheY-like chemotaxis protein